MTGSSEGLQMVFRENIRRFFAPVNHRGPVYLYGYIIFVLLAPWSVLLPAALGNANPRQSSDRFALVYFWGTFLFFTLASSRRSYYVLPILPAAALVIARLLTTESIRNRVVYGLMWTGHAVLGLSVLLGGIVLTLAPFIFGQWDFLQHVPARHLFVIALIGCFGALCWSLRMFGIARIRMALSVTAVVVMGYGYLVLWPFLDSLRTQKTFAQQVRSIPGLDLDHLTLFRNRDVVYYLGSAKPIRECYSAEALARKIQEAQIRWVIARQRDLATFTFPFKETVREVGHSWEEEARSGSKLILLEVQER
jgi:4-amino-4-deoxy-L-arabinose transferase-like glycosyltransferase